MPHVALAQVLSTKCLQTPATSRSQPKTVIYSQHVSGALQNNIVLTNISGLYGVH